MGVGIRLVFLQKAYQSLSQKYQLNMVMIEEVIIRTILMLLGMGLIMMGEYF